MEIQRRAKIIRWLVEIVQEAGLNPKAFASDFYYHDLLYLLTKWEGQEVSIVFYDHGTYMLHDSPTSLMVSKLMGQIHYDNPRIVRVDDTGVALHK